MSLTSGGLSHSKKLSHLGLPTKNPVKFCAGVISILGSFREGNSTALQACPHGSFYKGTMASVCQQLVQKFLHSRNYQEDGSIHRVFL